MKKCHFVKVFFLFLTAWILFSGCTSTKILGDSNIEPIYITNIKKLYLLPPFDIEKNIESEQLLTATFGGNSIALLAYLKADENEIFLSMFNDFGTGMGTLFYDGENISFDSPVFPKNLKSEYIVADLQFAYSSRGALPLLDIGEDILSAAGYFAQAVYLLVEAVLDNAAVL